MKDKKILLVLATVSLLLSSLSRADNTNSILIDQVSSTSTDNLDLTIEQVGYDNKIFFSLAHDNNLIDLKQEGHDQEIGYADDNLSYGATAWGSGLSWGGDLDGASNNIKLWQNCTKTTCNENDIQFHVAGSSNKMWWAQGYIIDSRTDTIWAKDTAEKGGHKVTIDIHGNNNSVIGQQRNCDTSSCSGHQADILIYGNDNDVFGSQSNDGVKNMYLRINTSGNEVDFLQTGNGAHNATITLNGSYATDLNLIQQGNSNQTYSLTQTCATSTGCNVTVTQQ